MVKKRLLELLAYAKVCFERCTNPFELVHLRKKNVCSDECIDLSNQIASIIDEWLNEMYNPKDQEEAIKQAEKEFMETQEDGKNGKATSKKL
jgi:hypothetical protein